MGGVSLISIGVVIFKRRSYGIASRRCRVSIVVGLLLRYKRLASNVKTIPEIIGNNDFL
jgi:hypothetical protein